jgi:hypothetical protein
MITLLLCPLDLLEAGLADAHFLRNLHPGDFRLILTAGTAEQFATGATVMAALVDGELDAAADAALGALVLTPVINHAYEKEMRN